MKQGEFFSLKNILIIAIAVVALILVGVLVYFVASGTKTGGEKINTDFENNPGPNLLGNESVDEDVNTDFESNPGPNLLGNESVDEDVNTDFESNPGPNLLG